MIAYRVVDNVSHRPLAHPVGGTYKAEPTKYPFGFHCCPNISDLFNFYDPTFRPTVLEIEVIGDWKPSQFPENVQLKFAQEMTVRRIVPESGISKRCYILREQFTPNLLVELVE